MAKNKKKKKTLSQIASSQVDAALAPLIANLQRRGETTQTNLSGIYDALAKSQEAAAPAIQQTYQTATANTGAFAKGYSDALKAQLGDSAAQANIELARNGSPQHVDGGEGAGDVLFGLGGSIPGQALAREGAAFTSAAQVLPGQARTLGAGEQAKALGSMNEEITKLEAEKPGLIQKALSELQAAQMDQQELGLKQALAQQQFGLSTARLGLDQARLQNETARVRLSVGNYKLQVQKYNNSILKAQAEGRAPDSQLSKLYGYIVDSTGAPILNGKNRKIPVKKSGSASELSPSTKSTTIGRARDEGNDALQKVLDRVWSNTPFSDVDPGEIARSNYGSDGDYQAALAAATRQRNQAEKTYAKRLVKNFGSAMAAVINAIGPHLRALGYTRAQIRAEARRIVTSEINR